MSIPPKTKVRVKADPAKIGYTTGNKKCTGSFVYWEVDFTVEKRNYLENQLEEVQETLGPESLFESGMFGTPENLRNVVVLEKLRGKITNMFYSMNISSAKFLAYQFKPVLKFIESASGRILIADEVGLGKTVEATYIWKELEARKDAKRLLIICPAVLREKWKHDLSTLFGISAPILDTSQLLVLLEETRTSPLLAFVGIVSMEAIRSKYSVGAGESQLSTADKIAKLFDEEVHRQADFKLLDLAIIDEAHYLRNPATANNKIATRIRDNSSHLVLLSATPVQTSEDNLFQLLQLIAPEEYYDKQAFSAAVKDNRPILDTIAAIGKATTSLPQIIEHGEKLSGLVDPTLISKMMSIYEGVPTHKDRVDLCWRLSEYSYLNEYLNRTRKRDVRRESDHIVTRHPELFEFSLSDQEKRVYDSVSAEIRKKKARSSNASGFILTLRQRHMTSCLPMGLRSYFQALSLSDDYAFGFEESEQLDLDLQSDHAESLYETSLSNTDALIEQLIANDSKFNCLYQEIQKLLEKNPHEKIILFSFFRSTVEYLEGRLQRLGIKTCLIKGGLGAEKFTILDAFAEETGPNILLSTEVGAEGLDLQFSRMMINYDLPWNPMKIEQRIGRIDRIGQQADKIFIFNIVCKNTIEDRVLYRLFDRIRLFEGTIGELDEILGPPVQDLMLEIVDSGLTEEEANQRADRAAFAMINIQRQSEELEDQSMNLMGFNDYIMQSIYDAKNFDRFISPADLVLFVEDFFHKKYPGSKVREKYDDTEYLRLITLSEEAKESLRGYINKHPSSTRTVLASQTRPVICVFDPQIQTKLRRNISREIIEIKHPLIQWIVNHYEMDAQSTHGCAAVRLSQKYDGVSEGSYVFVVQEWDVSSSVERKELRYFVKSLDTFQAVDAGVQERIVLDAMREGRRWEDVSIDIDLDIATKVLDSMISEILDQFTIYQQDMELEHKIRQDKQKRYAQVQHDRLAASIDSQIENLVIQGKSPALVKANQARSENIEREYKRQLLRIEGKRFQSNFRVIACGLIDIRQEVREDAC
jgi:ERCC4-related helicase